MKYANNLSTTINYCYRGKESEIARSISVILGQILSYLLVHYNTNYEDGSDDLSTIQQAIKDNRNKDESQKFINTPTYFTLVR